MSTNSLSFKDIKRHWHLIDAQNKVLGRLATEVAEIVMGKKKADFVPYLDNGDYVIVINAKEVKVSGRKEQQKKYFRHSGYPGGYREEGLAKLRERKPEDIIKHAVWGMIPKGVLGRQMLKKLHIYPASDHPFQDKLKAQDQPKKGETN